MTPYFAIRACKNTTYLHKRFQIIRLLCRLCFALNGTMVAACRSKRRGASKQCVKIAVVVHRAVLEYKRLSWAPGIWLPVCTHFFALPPITLPSMAAGGAKLQPTALLLYRLHPVHRRLLACWRPHQCE